ncbi:hypothetical protein AgCh_015174 [Apium graveolens]
MKRLHRYVMISGQLINYDKSAVTFSTNTKEEDRVEVCNELEVQQKLDPGKYLGLPMRIGANKTDVFEFLVEKVDKQLQAWKLQKISKAGTANTEFLEANLGANPSFMWRSIMASQEIVKQHWRRKIGDGRSTRVWHIPWLPSSENGCLTTTPHANIRDIVVQNLMGADLRSWDMDILNDLFNERDIDLIEQIPIPIHSRPDSWYWLLDDKGLFTVKSCYISIRGEHLNTEGGFVKFLWKLKFPGKIDLKRSQDCVVDDEQRRQRILIVELRCIIQVTEKMSEVFEGYERQYCELSDNLSKKCTSATLVDGEQKKQKLSEVKAGLDEAESLIRKMDMEARSLQPNVKAVLLAKLREYKSDLNNLKSQVKRISSTNLNEAARDDLLESGMADAQMVSQDQRGRLLMSTERLNKSSDRVRESRRTMLETEELGVSILHDLHQQRQSLLHANNTLHGVDDNISKSKKVLTAMSKRMSRNKYIIGSIVAVLVLAIVLILYFKLTN